MGETNVKSPMNGRVALMMSAGLLAAGGVTGVALQRPAMAQGTA